MQAVSYLFPVTCHDDYLFSISAPQHIAAHDVDEVGLRVQLAHQPTEPPPEPGRTGAVKKTDGQLCAAEEMSLG